MSGSDVTVNFPVVIRRRTTHSFVDPTTPPTHHPHKTPAATAMPFTGSDICKVCLVIPFTLLAQVSLIYFFSGSDPVRRPVAVANIA